MSPRRLEAEAIRDAILAVSGRLDPRMGGPGYTSGRRTPTTSPSSRPEATLGPTTSAGWSTSSSRGASRTRPSAPSTAPTPRLVAPRRNVSTTALQALNLLNSRFILDQSDAFAARLEREAGADPRPRSHRAFRLAFGRVADRGGAAAAAAALIRDHGAAGALPGPVNANDSSTSRDSRGADRAADDPPSPRPGAAACSTAGGSSARCPAGWAGSRWRTCWPSDGLLAADGPDRPERPSRPAAHFPPKARRVVHIFCTGAVSHLDTWDYKPELIKRHGQPMPGAEKLITFQGENGNLTRSPWEVQASRASRAR